MTRISKQGKVRAASPRRYRAPSPKTGPKRDRLEFGYLVHKNMAAIEGVSNRFIPKMGEL